MNKKRIVHILNSGNFSGAENIAVNIGVMFKKDYEIVLCFLKGGNLEKRVKDLGLNYILLEKFSLIELKNKINSLRPDIIHAHDFRASIYSGILFPGKCVISHLHNNPPWISLPNIYSLTYFILSFCFNKIIVVSKAIKDEFIFSPLISSKFICLPNFVDQRFILEKSQEEPLVKEEIDLLFVGRLTKEKNPLKFIEIIKHIKNYFTNIKSVMLGDGHLRKECERKIKEYNLTSNIFLLGYVDNPYPYIKNAKLLVMPSEWEGFGLVAVESMVLGKPVLASPVGGLKYIIKDGKTGYFCKRVDDFVERALFLLNNPQKLMELSINAENEAKNYVDIGIYKQKLASLYEEISFEKKIKL